MNIIRILHLSAVFFLVGTVQAQVAEPVTMLFAGDLTLSDNVERFVGSRTGYVFERWKPGREADIFMVNLEHPITTATEKVEKKFNFKMSPEYGAILLDAGVTLVNSANNHVFDYGLKGIEDTMRYLDSLGVPYTGIGRTLEEARRPVIIEKKGRKIGFLGYYGGGDFSASRERAGFAPRYARYILEDVRRLKRRVDYVVVNFHWGVERAALPDDWQVTLAKRVVDAGADLIVGHHPHVLQGIERYKGAVIAYSLGNFVFGGNSLHSYETAVLKVSLSATSADVELIPVSVKRWQPQPSTGEVRKSVLNLVRERSSLFPENLFLTGVVE
ncbi:MAG: CapA family protein [Bacteroidota bacterium]